ncbi:MAG: hypothetical protein NTV06_07380 [candidate division Zixibacteria bacterium]|nr:hypothetical protein [candidate division Zixibacteria bacterium]
MKKNSLFLMLLLLSAGVWAGPTPITPPNGVAFELIVRQKPATIEKYFEITRDTIKVLMGKPLSAFLVNFSLRVELKEADSQSVEFTTHLVTVGSTPFTAGERFRSEYNLPARIENIPGKDSSVYQLLISPRSLVIIDTSRCAYDPDVAGQYEYDPSANFDIYYVKGSLADFDWNNIKNYLETDYAYFRNALDITAPGKTSYYLCPCLSPSINWDKRFGYAIDPGRANVYSIYSQDFVSTDAMLPNMLKLLRLWGYAPPFLVEGLAGYFDFVTYEMKKIRKQEGFPEIKKLLTTSGYYSASPHTAEVTAASFIKFLADSYGIDKVKQLYEKSDDLTLMMNF